MGDAGVIVVPVKFEMKKMPFQIHAQIQLNSKQFFCFCKAKRTHAQLKTCTCTSTFRWVQAELETNALRREVTSITRPPWKWTFDVFVFLGNEKFAMTKSYFLLFVQNWEQVKDIKVTARCSDRPHRSWSPCLCTRLCFCIPKTCCATPQWKSKTSWYQRAAL